MSGLQPHTGHAITSLSGGKTPLDNCKMYEPLTPTRAGQHHAFIGLGKKYEDVAERVPGPSTAYFGELAKKQ